MALGSGDELRIELPMERPRAKAAAAAANGGGYLVGEEVPAAYDVLRPWSTVTAAGVQILEGLRPGGAAVLNGDDPRLVARGRDERRHVHRIGGHPQLRIVAVCQAPEAASKG